LFERRIGKVIGMSEDTRKELLDESVRGRIIFGLATQPINLRTILENKEISWFFYPRMERRALRRALFRAEKYLVKRRINVESALGKEVADRMVEAWGCRCLIDEALSTVLGFYEISGGAQLDYRTFSYKIMRIVKEYHIKEWVRRILDAIKYWKGRYKVNRDALHAVALATAKITAEYYHGNRWHGFRYMRLERPVKEAVGEVERGILKSEKGGRAGGSS